MFVQDYAYIAQPYEDVVTRFKRNIHECMNSAAVSSQRRCQRVLRVGPSKVFSKQVYLDIHEARERGDSFLLPFSWTSTGRSALFPSLEGELEIASLDGTNTQLTLHATYQPPLGAFGYVTDKAVMNRVAQATIRHFLVDLCGLVMGTDPSSGNEEALRFLLTDPPAAS